MGITTAEIVPYSVAGILFVILAFFFGSLTRRFYFLKKLVSRTGKDDNIKSE